MAKSYSLIQAQTLTSTATSVTFSNIPQNFTDLVVKASARSDTASTFALIYVKFNGSASNYSMKLIGGSGSAASSLSETSGRAGVIDAASNTSSTFSNIELYVPNYASSNYKSVSTDSVMENNATEAYANLNAILWSDLRVPE